MTTLSFETLGNATLQVFENDRPILVTDPWLVGTAYFGSWALDHDLTPAQIQHAASSPFAWISHGHPDHLHGESLQRLSRAQRMLVPDHYHPEIRHYLEGLGFDVTVLRFKTWTPLTASIRVMCLENENQDAILVVQAGDSLIIDANDSPLAGEEPFLRRLIRRSRTSYYLALCSLDADMINVVDDEGRRVTTAGESHKRGAVAALADICTRLGVTHYCCFSSQHLYVRPDSTWANPHRIGFADMKRYWRSAARLIEPFVTVALDDGAVTPNHPSHQSDLTRLAPSTGADDWNERMGEEDWQALERFVRKFRTLRRCLDFIGFTVAGESRVYRLSANGPGRRGVTFMAPRHSLMETVESGYFDDLLIGNFMKTHLSHLSLYPDFTPLIAKFGGNAKVYTRWQLLACRLHYFRLSPLAYARYRIQVAWLRRWKPRARAWLHALGALETLKRWTRRIRGGFPPAPMELSG